ncbi:diguanylate cyclase (GGDEF) domain-containing protein [Clostridium cavendishii DSM 21758]|uniref:Diguanylate cyclase (GGDEF) domain-containing protein n=1 Tax=Clostridium cavendishii DSM 21758 TaxID=1121302 RepID=A0A1M6DLZ2_9CLOT|nr:GGDEF domain-containing protein [Clostridium cavendishii]SHI74337.1 diguanylate cyclase (GGDEF) domain-containing protein [Clostridium cavendishii DSM 21758]
MLELSKVIVFLFVLTLFIYMLWMSFNIFKLNKFLIFLMSIGLGLITLGTFLDVISNLTYINFYICIKVSFTLGAIIFTIFILLGVNYIKKEIDVLNKFIGIDIMTGVYNRKGIEECFKKFIEEKKMFYIMFFDLDKTKIINDNFGHLIGDEYIRNSAKIIYSEIGMHGAVGRIGGDEFVAILQYTNEEKLEHIKASIKKEVSNIFKDENTSISIGHSVYGKDDVDFRKLLNIADERMYEDKKSVTGFIN